TAVSSIIAQRDKTGVYIGNTIGNQWTANLIRGMADGGLDIALGGAWESYQQDISSFTGSLKFVAGYNIGFLYGIGYDIYENVKGLLEILVSVAKYYGRAQYEPLVVLGEIVEMLKKLSTAF